MTKTNGDNPLDNFVGGITGLFIGYPGSGKSWLLGSIGEIAKNPLLIAPKPREINSFQYRKYGLDQTAKIFKDHRWKPSLDSFEAGAFVEMERFILSLYEDEEHDVILLDPLTDVVNLAAHDLLKGEKAETPKDLRDSIGFYGALKYRLKNFVQTLTGLASPDLARPKHVLVAVHAQPTKESDIKGNATADKTGKGVEFQGDVLPMIEGGYRREIAGEFDVVGFTSLKHERSISGGKVSVSERYIVQLNADSERHAKAAMAPRLSESEVGNTMSEVLQAILGEEG